MPKVIRQSAFETNSSSSHSLTNDYPKDVKFKTPHSKMTYLWAYAVEENHQQLQDKLIELWDSRFKSSPVDVSLPVAAGENFYTSPEGFEPAVNGGIDTTFVCDNLESIVFDDGYVLGWMND